MKLSWSIEPEDIEKVRAIVASQRDDPFVKHRIAKNLADGKPQISWEHFWECMVACILTTRQRSGPTSGVSKFIQTRPFPLRYSLCVAHIDDILDFTRKVLNDFGGFWRAKNIAGAVAANLEMLERGGWARAYQMLDKLRAVPTREMERTVADFIDREFVGFGPKQSRNLRQSLGLTRFEIPIDSRITKWLNDLDFPVPLSAAALADRPYYEFVTDIFQQLCKEADVMPCILDAAIFASYDKGGWTEENVVW